MQVVSSSDLPEPRVGGVSRQESAEQPVRLAQKIKVWHLLIGLVVFSSLAVWQLRQNNITMLKLREAVVVADTETGDIDAVEPHLLRLGGFVLGHMNTSLAGPVELPGTYNKAVEAARKEAETSGTANGQVYKDAQVICENPNIPLTARAQCMQDYVLRNAPPGSDHKELVFPDKSLYSYNFRSPLWSLDWAGLFTSVSVLLASWVTMRTFRHWLEVAITRSLNSDPLE